MIAVRADEGDERYLLPVRPLMDATGSHTVAELGLRIGVHRQTVTRHLHNGGLEPYRADRWATVCGMHPAEVWGHDWWAAELEHDDEDLDTAPAGPLGIAIPADEPPPTGAEEAPERGPHHDRTATADHRRGRSPQLGYTLHAEAFTALRARHGMSLRAVALTC